MTNDATYEKLADLHAANPNGLMVHQDEMIALMRKLDNPDNRDWRAFALTGWGGKSSHTVDRIGRGTQTVPHVCLSLFGATQPERIAAYVRPAITGSEDDDGLCQRFQMMVWPDADKPWIYVDEWPDREAKEMVWQVVKWLDSFDPVKDVGALLPDFGARRRSSGSTMRRKTCGLCGAPSSTIAHTLEGLWRVIWRSTRSWSGRWR